MEGTAGSRNHVPAQGNAASKTPCAGPGRGDPHHPSCWFGCSPSNPHRLPLGIAWGLILISRQLIGFSLIKLRGSTVRCAGGEPRCRSLAGSCSRWGRRGEGPAWGPARNPSRCFGNEVSPNERTGRSEGLERGQPRWPRGVTPSQRGPWGRLRAMGTVAPVLGLSHVTLGAGRCSSPPPVTAALRSNGNFYAVKWKFLCESEIFRAFFFPLKGIFPPVVITQEEYVLPPPPSP